MSEKLKPYKTIWVRFISDSKSGLKFLGEKEYPYHVTKLCFEEMIKLSGSGNYLCFTIKNGSGYDYHGAEVVWMNYTEPVIDSQVSTLTEVIHTGRLETIKEEFDSFGNPHILRQSVKIIHLKSKKLIYSSDMEDSCVELTEPDELTITTNRDAKDVIDRLKCTFDDLGAEAKKASKCLSNMAVSINDYSNEPMYSNTSDYDYLKGWDNLRTSKSIYALDTASEPDFCSISWLKENPYLTLKGDNNEIMINEKENKTMFENVFKGFEFGVATSVRTSIYGPAFHCGNTFVSYDKATGTYIDVTDLLFDIENMNYRMPIAANAVSVGDYIIHQHKWVRVLECLDAGRLQVEDIQERQVITILPVKNVFGFEFYTKLFCFADNLFGEVNAENPFGNLLPLMLMNKDSKNDNLLPLMFMGGGFNGGNAQMNPLMMYALMGNKGNDNTLLMLMMMNGGNGFNFPNLTPAAFTQHENKVGEDE
jgi:hypothetical protein